MKKFLALFLGIILCLSLVACREKQESFEIVAEFSFYKDGNKKDKFEGNEFEVNTKIYVCVDFSITKHVAKEEIISFIVQIPYAEYYSTKDYYEGTIKPIENPYTQQDLNGNEYTVMELNQMNFVFNDNATHDFHYIFEIEANQTCNNAEFITRFKPENSNLTVSVNSVKDNKSKTTYTFIDSKGE